ncbi:hypothetical protein PUR29_31345 [Methylobacterium ajmalii]|uniref:DUF7146 domain-containing protein n=2 Tax=Methylobacterium TaxID=407 RepID=A0A0C6FPM5_9HYPH|nr:hypothetical protein [Methylobacterium aquaticum]BAQ50243.1 conserved hypothetical protein [Methylobacterium aquaticum]
MVSKTQALVPQSFVVERTRSLPEGPRQHRVGLSHAVYGRLVPGTVAAAYLRSRGLKHAVDQPALRFHPRCLYRPSAK